MSLSDEHRPTGHPPQMGSASQLRAPQRPWIDTRYVLSQMRVASGLSVRDLAAQLGTSEVVIAALEQREYAKLPFWPEVSRVLNGFGKLLGLDISPLIQQYQRDLTLAHKAHPHGLAPWHPVGAAPQASRKQVRQSPAAHLAPMAMPKALRKTPDQSTRRRAKRRQHLRGVLSIAATILVAAGIWVLLPVVVKSLQNPTTAELPKVVEPGNSLFQAFKLPKREETGVRWLSLNDPALRKSSRLPSSNN